MTDHTPTPDTARPTPEVLDAADRVEGYLTRSTTLPAVINSDGRFELRVGDLRALIAAARESTPAPTEALRALHGSGDGKWCDECGHDFPCHTIRTLDAARTTPAPTEARAALLAAADEMEAVIAEGDSAEACAPVSGEVGRSTVVGRRDALYEEPDCHLVRRPVAQWDRADRIETDA